MNVIQKEPWDGRNVLKWRINKQGIYSSLKGLRLLLIKSDQSVLGQWHDQKIELVQNLFSINKDAKLKQVPIAPNIQFNLDNTILCKISLKIDCILYSYI